MGIDVNSINWFKENLGELSPLTNWTRSRASVVNGNVQIEPGGYIETVIQRSSDELLSTSKYLKLGLDTLEYPEDIGLYQPMLSVTIKDTYNTDDSDFNKSITRKLSVNKMNTKETSPINANYKHSVHLIGLMGKPLQSIYFKIQNNTDSVKTITWYGLYESNDIGEVQYNKVQNESMFMFGTMIEPRTSDPVNPAVGRIWLRTDIEPSETDGSGETIITEGTVWYDGSGAPDNSLGKDYDYYLDNSTGNVWHKANGEWVCKTNIKGKDGIDVTKWYDGSGAPTTSIGAEGDYYLDTDTGDVYAKESTGWVYKIKIKGTDGTNGTDGKDGLDGSKWYDGEGIPSSDLGANGDYYLDTATGDVYARADDVWGLRGNIKGASGSGGDAGDDNAGSGDNTSGDTGDGSGGTGDNNKGVGRHEVEYTSQLTSLSDAKRGDIATLYRERVVQEATSGWTSYYEQLTCDGKLARVSNTYGYKIVNGKHFRLGKLYITGDDGTETATNTHLFVSDDGINFTTLSTLNNKNEELFMGNAGNYIYIGTGYYTSGYRYDVDVTTLTVTRSSSNSIKYYGRDYEFGDKWYRITSGGYGYISEDGYNWTLHSNYNNRQLRDIIYVSDDEIYFYGECTPTGGSSRKNGIFKTDINFSTITLLLETGTWYDNYGSMVLVNGYLYADRYSSSSSSSPAAINYVNVNDPTDNGNFYTQVKNALGSIPSHYMLTMMNIDDELVFAGKKDDYTICIFKVVGNQLTYEYVSTEDTGRKIYGQIVCYHDGVYCDRWYLRFRYTSASGDIVLDEGEIGAYILAGNDYSVESNWLKIG